MRVQEVTCLETHNEGQMECLIITDVPISFNNNSRALFRSYPETETRVRSWCAARAMEHPLDRVLYI